MIVFNLSTRDLYRRRKYFNTERHGLQWQMQGFKSFYSKNERELAKNKQVCLVLLCSTIKAFLFFRQALDVDNTFKTRARLLKASKLSPSSKIQYKTFKGQGKDDKRLLLTLKLANAKLKKLYAQKMKSKCF